MPDITQENTLNPTDLPYIETSNGVFTLTVIRSEVIHFQWEGNMVTLKKRIDWNSDT